MDLKFGYNCKYYLPTLRKCRKLIDSYLQRPDLLEQNWLSTEEVLVYLNVRETALISGIESGEIKVKRRKNGKLIFSVQVPAQYDGCYLASILFT